MNQKVNGNAVAQAVASAVDFNPVRPVELSPVYNVQAGGKFTLEVPMTYRLHDVYFQVSNIPDLTKLTELEVKINGDVKHKYQTAADLDKMNQQQGIQAYSVNSILRIPFERHNLRETLAQERTALNCGVPDKHGYVINSVQISGRLDATLTNPALTPYARVSAPRPGKYGDIISVLPYDYNNPFSGTPYDVTDIPRDRRDVAMLDKIFFKNADITKVKLKRDNRDGWERTKEINDYEIANGGRRSVVAGWFMVDPSEDGQGDRYFRMAGFNDVRWQVTQSTNGALTVYAHHLGSLQ